MKVKELDVTPLGPWHAWRIGFLPRRTYDGRWRCFGMLARRRVRIIEPHVILRERWQYADLDQVLATAP